MDNKVRLRLVQDGARRIYTIESIVSELHSSDLCERNSQQEFRSKIYNESHLKSILRGDNSSECIELENGDLVTFDAHGIWFFKKEIDELFAKGDPDKVSWHGGIQPSQAPK